METLEKIVQEHLYDLKITSDLEPLVQKLSSAKIVMLGESTHGTHEFYEWRRKISQALITKHGFNFIAVEGDWPPCHAVNEFVRSPRQDTTPRQVLKEFRRWPTWMWANTEILRLVEWMKLRNQSRPAAQQVGFYGLDVYSLFESIDEVIKVLKQLDPNLVRYAQILYGCFEPYQRDEKSYAKSLMKFSEGCEVQVLKALQQLLQVRLEGPGKNQIFNAQQNARIVKNAERYYRAMIHGDEDSWNVRDQHMMETLNLLLTQHGPSAKAIVWAHNTHIGDYRATDMVNEGQLNIGGLAREQWGFDNVALVGFSTYQGEVIASHAWDGPIETMIVPPGQADSYEDFFHKISQSRQQDSFYLWIKDSFQAEDLGRRGHRAIGVVYHPAYETYGNYVPTTLAQRYDAFIFCDRTSTVHPLHQKFLREEIPQTWPRGT